MKKQKSQRTVVREWLEEYGHITSMQAFHLFSITRLASVIYDLRKKEGMEIETVKKMVDTPYGKTEIADYRVER